MTTTVAIGRFDRTPPYLTAIATGINIDWQLPFERTASNWLTSVLAELRQTLVRYGHDGWDGEGSRAVTMETASAAYEVISRIFERLPLGTPQPDIGPDPDGEISVSWVAPPDQIFSFSIGSHDKINFAGQFVKGGSQHGCLPMNRESRAELLDTVEELSRHITGMYSKNAAKRAA